MGESLNRIKDGAVEIGGDYFSQIEISQVSAGDEHDVESIDIVFDADYQHNLISQVSPIQSRTFDSRIDVSVRPMALNLATPILQRESQHKIDELDYDYRYQLGDVVDSSNLAEWVIYLVSSLDRTILADIFGLPEDASTWADEDWQKFNKTLDQTEWRDYLMVIEDYYRSHGVTLPAGPQGNHDGAAWGNGINQPRPIVLVEMEIMLYTFQQKFLDTRIRKLQEQIETGVLSTSERRHLELKLERLNTKLSEIDQLLSKSVSTKDSGDLEESASEVYYTKQKVDLERRVADIEMRLHDEALPPQKREHLKEKLERYERRLEYINHKLTVLEREKVRALAVKDLAQVKRGKLRVPQFMIDAILGVRRGKSLVDSEGYWAKNAGGADLCLDKADYLYHYLKGRYPELGIMPHEGDLSGDLANDDGLMPLAVKIMFNSVGTSENSGIYRVEKAVRGESGEFLKDDDGKFVTEVSRVAKLDSTNKAMIAENFENFWTEVRPGEFTSLVSCAEGECEYPNQRYIFLQAFDQGVVNGKRVFNIFLDGMDGTQQEIDLAFFGSMSRLQRQLCQVFISAMRKEYDGEVLFMHSSHFALSMYDKDYWRESGWQDYFSSPDVIPVVFCGHGHQRDIIDESKKTLFGKNNIFGESAVAKGIPMVSVMTPSVTDAPNEFMSVSLTYDAERDAYILKQQYHDVVDLADESRFDPEVVAAVSSLAMLYESHAYRDYARVNDGLLGGITGMVFSQERVLAEDAIPLSVGQFAETITYARTYRDLMQDEFGEDDEFVRLITASVKSMELHYNRFLQGDENSDDPYENMGYEKAVKEAKKFMVRKDRIALLSHFDGVFDCPGYERLRLLIAQTPADSKAYEFWLLLGKRAAVEEAAGKKKKAVPDQNEFVFRM